MILGTPFVPAGTPSPNDPVIAAVGDMSCDPSDSENYNQGRGTAGTCQMKATSDLVAGQNGLAAILALGDLQYDDGTLAKFQQSYEPTWGRVKAITHPAVGNHEYLTPGAQDYYSYFGAAAGDPGKGYYSFDLGTWHLIALNSNCQEVGGCGFGSPQEQWLRADLAAHPAPCTLAYWHHPRWSSAHYGNDPTYSAFWQDLYDGGAEIVLNGHEHDYERFTPQDPFGVADEVYGVREIVVGTGGENLREFKVVQANSLVRSNNTFGVLALTLHPAGYDWRFVPVAGKTFTDSGAGACHPAPAQAQRSDYQTTILADQPVGYWRLGEGRGAAAADGAGGNAGRVAGGVTLGVPGAVEGDPNTAMQFNGTDGYVEAADNADLDPTGDLSLEVWAKPAALDSATHAIVHKGDGPSSESWQYRLTVHSTNQWRGCLYTGAGENSDICLVAPTPPSTDAWTYLVLTRSGSTVTLYVNGIGVATTTTIATNLTTTTGSLAIGRMSGTAMQYFNGGIDEVAVYNKALTAAQVRDHYRAARPRP